MDEPIFETMLTTVDNPWDPFTQFANWFLFDMRAGHNSCGVLAKAAIFSDSMSPKEREEEVNRACDEIIAEDPFHIYKKVTKETNVKVVKEAEGADLELSDEDFRVYADK